MKACLCSTIVLFGELFYYIMRGVCVQAKLLLGVDLCIAFVSNQSGASRKWQVFGGMAGVHPSFLKKIHYL